MTNTKVTHTNKGTGITIKVKPGATTEERKANLILALRKFKKKQKEYGILMEIKQRSEFTKPSAKRRHIKQKAIARRIHQDKKLEILQNDWI